MCKKARFLHVHNVRQLIKIYTFWIGNISARQLVTIFSEFALLCCGLEMNNLNGDC